MIRALHCIFLLLPLLQIPGVRPLAPGEIQDDRGEVRRRAESFEKLTKDPDKDADAVAMLDGMIAMFKDSGPRDKARILKSVVASAKVFDTPKDKTKSRNLPIAAAQHMSGMGTDAIKPIQELLADAKVGKEMPRVMPLAAALVKLGMGTPEALDSAIKMLDDANPRLFVAIAPALATLELETQAKRKRAAGALLASSETFPQRCERGLVGDDKAKFANEGSVAALATLNALAVQKQPDVAAFKAWFAQNKDKPWPEK